MDDDLIGTVRREDFESGHSIWVRLDADATPGNEWSCVWSTYWSNIGCTRSPAAVADDLVIGAVPGTPAAAGLLAAPAAQPAPFTDLTARLAAADAGWGLASGDGPSNPDYIRFLAQQFDAFEDHASPAAPAELRRWTEGAPQPADNPAVQDGRGRVWVHDEGPWWTAIDSNAHPVLQWAMLARVGITEVPSISDVAAPADDEPLKRLERKLDTLRAINRPADAVMAKVAPLVEKLRQAEVSRDAYRDERDQTQRERDEARASVEHLRGDYRRIRKDRDRLLLAWRSARRRANAWRAAATTEIPRWDEDAVVRRLGFLQPDQCGKCGEVNPRLTEALWLHAEAVWQRNEARERADKRLVKYVAVADELDAQKALRASAVQLPESWVGNLWNTLATRIDDLDNLNDAYEAVKLLIESWRPATVEAAPEPLRWEHAYSCVCGQPDSPGVVHRISGPCYADETSAGVSGTGTEAAPLADVPEAEWQEFHKDVTSARGPETQAGSPVVRARLKSRGIGDLS